MAILRDDGTLRLDGVDQPHVLSVRAWRNGVWQTIKLAAENDGWTGGVREGDDLRVMLRLEHRGDHFRYKLRLQSSRPTRLQLMLSLPGARNAYHVIPGVIFGDNNLAHAEPGHFPNLTTRHPGNISCSPYWELRADRASHPLSIVCFDGGIAAVSIDPYSDGRPVGLNGGLTSDEFIRNGVLAQVAHDDLPDACGVTLGYGNLPRTFLDKDKWRETTAHLITSAQAQGCISIEHAGDRLAAHRVIRRVYHRYRQTPATPISAAVAVTALTNAFLRVNWHDDSGRNALGSASAQASEFFGGGKFREQFTNMRCSDDPQKKTLTAWRTLAEIGWTGGSVIGYPLLVAGHRLANRIAIELACYVLDWVAEAYNPASGLLWDVCGKHEGKRLNWWWSGYLVKDCHCAYTNGTAAYYLLKAARYAARHMKEDRPVWRVTALRVLDTMCRLQQPDGGFGFTYAADRPAILDAEGFAGCWFVPAMLLAYQATDERRYLDAARRGAEHYHAFVRELNCWGTPMDTWKAVDQEGNLAFLRGARLLHEITGEARYLKMLIDSADYEYLWRLGFAARPQYKPLKGSHFGSCGGSITSVSNPHVHPMGISISDDLGYVARLTGDDYHAARFEDGVNHGINIVSLYPQVTGYGIPGVLSERFCPSDGLTVETFPDGSPSSIWFSYNGWAAAAVLEGLLKST